MVLASAAIALAANAALADPVAVIAAVKGRVDVTSSRGGSPQRAAFGRPLERGDRLSVAAGGAATLFFNDGNVIELSERSTLTVSGKVAGKASAGPAAALPSEVYASVSRFVAGGSRATGLVATSSLRGSDDLPFLIAPRRTAVLTDRPSFVWREVTGATRYRVTVSAAEQGELWTREVGGLTVAWPSDVAAAAAGDVLWEVEALTESRPLRKESSAFQVLVPAQAATIRDNLDRIRESAGGPESPAARFLTGSYLSALGLYHDATEHFGALCRLSPASPAPHEKLGDLYTKVGLMDLAAAAYKQATALHNSTP